MSHVHWVGKSSAQGAVCVSFLSGVSGSNKVRALKPCSYLLSKSQEVTVQHHYEINTCLWMLFCEMSSQIIPNISPRKETSEMVELAQVWALSSTRQAVTCHPYTSLIRHKRHVLLLFLMQAQLSWIQSVQWLLEPLLVASFWCVFHHLTARL